MVFCQVAIITGKTVKRIIIRINTAAPLEITERYDVIFTGDPSYTSAVQSWKGTIDILNAIPAKKKINPSICKLVLPNSFATSLK
jgi:hypothetical protein